MAHPLHADPSTPSNPMLQMQSVILSLVTGDFVFGGHDTHTEAFAAYSPALHEIEHVNPSPPYPLLQTHVKLPSVLLQFPFTLQLFTPPKHSSESHIDNFGVPSKNEPTTTPVVFQLHKPTLKEDAPLNMSLRVARRQSAS
eukprot:2261823-Rhodomonas_salina.1